MCSRLRRATASTKANATRSGESQLLGDRPVWFMPATSWNSVAVAMGQKWQTWMPWGCNSTRNDWENPQMANLLAQ